MGRSNRGDPETDNSYVVSQEQLDESNEFRFGPERQICERYISGAAEIVQTEFYGYHICGDVNSQPFSKVQRIPYEDS